MAELVRKNQAPTWVLVDIEDDEELRARVLMNAASVGNFVWDSHSILAAFQSRIKNLKYRVGGVEKSGEEHYSQGEKSCFV